MDLEIINKDYCSCCGIKDVPFVRKARTKTKTKIIQYFNCRKCCRQRQKKYYKENTDKCRAILRRSTKKYSYKQEARLATHKAINSGKLNKKESCELCGGQDRIQAHHEDYSKPTKVQWLCTSCHSAVHK